MDSESSWTSSYVYGNDTYISGGGWGQRYFYTYFTQMGQRTIMAYVECAILMLIFMLSVVANLSIASAVLRYREMRTVTNCFLLNLAVADLLFAAGAPLVALARLSPVWRFGSLPCRILPYSQFVCGFVLLWTLTLISMDRHRCLAVPPYRSELTPRRAILLTLFTWLLAAVVFLPVAALFRYYPDTRICTLVFPPNDYVNLSLVFVVPVTFLSCILPMSLLVFHYQRIFHKLLKTRSRWMVGDPIEQTRRAAAGDQCRKISIHHIVNPGSRTGSFTHHEEVRLKKHIHVVRVILLNVLVVLIMWLPITIIMFLIYVDGSRSNEDTNFFLRSHHFLWALVIALLNTVVNPLLFGFLSENFRSYLARMWLGSKRHGTSRSQCLDDCASRAASVGTKTQNSLGEIISNRQSLPSLTDITRARAV